ncbi:Coenzyme F420 hydrogenase/dehydrogenase, beta subunit C-terminal domain [Sphingomonas sp. KR1UV-12]|uniref:Coenzyme F420 hydrogenase/dehydrogenase, beta subunit C-terminal domain n=1 Tax=Sphingomonas aurea TaxID=3063994 RepID=A0ABT9ELB3_9SPHN|nr:Coenzyme F420 hydrogenase/dehydrogenase, beta subunit C-terminal domain [Sphingomonas sp. KR1UV-12]MDP1027724.1 Coenzyme F420 hydrogenase/dehydrogenase, beta subunit C-terminal domain [Sphingomonas sp. KR1UV-12]
MAEPTPAAIVGSGLCIGCGSCGADAGRDMAWDRNGLRAPVGALDMAGEAFARTCPFSPQARDEDAIAAARFPTAPVVDPRIGRFESAHVGHVAEGDFRSGGSSGGLVSWVANELLRTGAIDGVAHVVPTDGADGVFFRYAISRSAEDVARGARSRYFPVDLAAVIREIRATPGRYAIVGVPCFIKAINLLRAEDAVLAERVTHLLGLFCGHMKSAAFVDSFAWQLGALPEQVRAVEYRRKDAGRPANWYTAQLELADGSVRDRDWWHLADGDWGAGFFQASACNWCDDVVAETADIAFGDAWVEPYASDGRGTNVAIVRSPELRDMIADGVRGGRLSLEAVDADFIADTQAAGLRQRREGLAYRLTWPRSGITPRKRVAPGRGDLGWRRRLIYRARYAISRDSHCMARLARRTGQSWLYVRWAAMMLGLYQGLAYHRGWAGRLFDWLERRR